MGNIWTAIIAAIGSSGIVGYLVAWIKERRMADTEVTKVIREMSKEAVVEARDSLREIREQMALTQAKLDRNTEVLAEVARILKVEILPYIPENCDEAERHLKLIYSKIKDEIS